MSISSILIFILFLGPLVFFHELGHFLFARFFGVRVETFSIGFGPKLFSFKRGDTTYAVSAIPLGGYVKMFGDDPLNPDKVAEEERQFSFIFKTKWQRFWIVFGGPLANFILAFVLFWGLSMMGEKVPEIKIGVVKEENMLQPKGFQTGDVIHKINDVLIRNPTDLLGNDLSKVNTVTVMRKGQPVQLNVGMEGKAFFDIIMSTPPLLLDLILVNSSGVEFTISGFPKGTSLEEVLNDQSVSSLTLVNSKKESVEIALTQKGVDQRKLEIFSNGFYTTDLMIEKIKEESPAARSKLLPKDILQEINGVQVTSFAQLRDLVQKNNKEKIQVKFIRDGKTDSTEMIPELIRQDGKVLKLIGVFSGSRFLPPNYVWTDPLGIGASMPVAFQRSISAMKKTFDGFIMLITGEVSFKTVGGPVTIGKVAKDSYDISISYFLQLMALFSINLGVINLFPIPILDGGHILFIVLEIINRGPISRRKMEIAQQVGLSIILLLMFGALFNDFTR
jgi:regulator of sigma E protease